MHVLDKHVVVAATGCEDRKLSAAYIGGFEDALCTASRRPWLPDMLTSFAVQ